MIKVRPEPTVTNNYVTGRNGTTDNTCVYRHFSNDGELLYVGASIGPLARMEEHRSTANWLRKIVRIEIQWFDTYAEAIDAERAAIRNERPAHNAMRYECPEPRKSKPRPSDQRKKMGRPKKHASGADRQRAYRQRKAAHG